jgi:hypothetical protein
MNDTEGNVLSSFPETKSQKEKLKKPIVADYEKILFDLPARDLRTYFLYTRNQGYGRNLPRWIPETGMRL